MNLVMIGRFKTIGDANKAKEIIDRLTENLPSYIDVGNPRDDYGTEMLNLLSKLNCYSIGPAELEQFLYDVSVEIKDDSIILKTDEHDVSAFLKVFIENGARVEIYSAHDYKDTPYGRGK
jgi:hypothetical protein